MALALTFVTFGIPRLLDENSVTVAFPEKGLLAAAYIASRPSRSVTRAELSHFLWGEDSGNPLVNLRQLLTRVRARQKEAGIALLQATDTTVTLADDAADFDFVLLKSLPSGDPLKIVEMSLACMTGGFFAGAGTMSDNATLWISAERDQLLGRLAVALEDLSRQDDGNAYQPLRKQAAYCLLEFDPHNEIAYRTLIEAFSAEGNVTQAQAVFERYRSRLRADLGAQPDGTMLAMQNDVVRRASTRLPAVPSLPGADSPRHQVDAGRRHLPRILILPPANDSGMLASGLLEDVTISLCRARTLLVVAPHTARRVAVMDENGRQDAYRTCNASYLLESRSASDGGSQTLFISLVSIADETIVWADRLSIDAAELAHAYNVMVQHVAAQTVASIERHQFAVGERATTPSAYQHYLLGQSFVRTLELPDIRRARKAFRASLRDMPNFSPALGGLSRTEHLEWLLTARGDHELLESSERHAQLAMKVDDSDSAGFHQLAITRLYRGAFDESIELFEKAESNAPSYADLIADHADTLNHSSRLEEALDKINLAFEYNPLCPDYYWWVAAGVNFSLRRYQAAIDNLNQVADQSNVSRFSAACWAMLGDTRKAQVYMRRTMKVLPNFTVDSWTKWVPIRDPEQRDHYREALYRAGFK